MKLESIIGLVVMLFILIILFAAIYPIFPMLDEQIGDACNATGTNYTTVHRYTGSYPRIFGFFCLCFGIAIIVLFAASAHRKEHEEYDEAYRYNH